MVKLNKDELIDKLMNFELQCSGDLDEKESTFLKSDAGVLKSEFYLSLEQFDKKEEAYYYINRTQALIDKLTYQLDYNIKLLKKIKQKIYSRMGQEEYQDFIQECKREIG